MTAPWWETVAEALWRHKIARPADEPMTWCVCLCWSTARGALADDERAHNQHVADALAPIIERLLTEARAEHGERIAQAIEAGYLGPDFGRSFDGRESPDSALHHAYDEGLEYAARIARAAAQTPATSPEEGR